ncbi:MAG: hypothetical protein QOF60_1334 [Actinomycetota bacterium]|jgi:arylsulfatase A-like enzyme|nr:hypothetical protein [Actinomycetota bacterium]
MGRKILFITTDQQRYDALGCNGGGVARTPVVDGLAAAGIRYTRGHSQSVVCMPSRSTMITGQHSRTHGVWMNGVPLPADAPSVAAELHDAGYETALVGKAHFEPFLDPERRFLENRIGVEGSFGAGHRGFDHMELATHSVLGMVHYSQWMMREHSEDLAGFYPNLGRDWNVNGEGGGDTGAIQVKVNPVPRERYHTDWVADRTIAWLDSLDADADWFVWMSFPDPHHPWDPPASETGRVDWRDLDLPERYLSSAAAREALIADRPAQWAGYYSGGLVANFEAPPSFRPADLTGDQIREINALVHVENELIDEACGRVLARIGERGWGDDTDVFFTTDHGELQGDYGLLFKGGYHVDSLLRVPFVWRPAPSSGLEGGVVVDAPVGHLDLAPTFCAIAGLEPPAWMEGRPLPTSRDDGRERVMTEWDSVFNGVEMHLRTIYRDGYLCTAYEPGTEHDGSEGELYDMNEDPLQLDNVWSDPARKALREDLVADLYDSLPAPLVDPRPVVANV